MRTKNNYDIFSRWLCQSLKEHLEFVLNRFKESNYTNNILIEMNNVKENKKIKTYRGLTVIYLIASITIYNFTICTALDVQVV